MVIVDVGFVIIILVSGFVMKLVFILGSEE